MKGLEMLHISERIFSSYINQNKINNTYVYEFVGLYYTIVENICIYAKSKFVNLVYIVASITKNLL